MPEKVVIVLVHQHSISNSTLTVSVGGRVIGTVLEDAPQAWIAKPPADTLPRHPSLTAAVEWLVAQRGADAPE